MNDTEEDRMPEEDDRRDVSSRGGWMMIEAQMSRDVRAIESSQHAWGVALDVLDVPEKPRARAR